MNKRDSSHQYSLLGGDPVLPRTLYINKPKQFDQLLHGFRGIKAISYVTSPSLVVGLFEKMGFERMEILVGENVSIKHYKKELQGKSLEFIEKMLKLAEEQRLAIYFPSRKTVHSKMYILENAECCRVIVGSANFSETAWRAVKQDNYVVYWDLPGNSPLLEHFLKDYAAHLKGALLFLGDLMELLGEKSEEPRPQVIRYWLSQDVEQVRRLEDAEAMQTLRAITGAALDVEKAPVVAAEAEPEEKEAVYVQVPGSVRSLEALERRLKPVAPLVSGTEMKICKADYARHVRKLCSVPLMGMDRERGAVVMRMDEGLDVLSAPPEDPAQVDQGLAHLESYIETFRFGETLDLKRVQMNVFEAFLHVVSAPFAHEFKKLKMSVDRYTIGPRGPKYLYIYGPSYNGKTNFLRLCLKIITGRDMEPIAQENFKKTSILAARQYATVFPLVFDDVSIVTSIEPVLKHYWEVWWEEEVPAPQLIMTSNQPNPKEWAETRIKRVNFDVKFDHGNPAGAQALSKVLGARTDFFRWFSYLYLKKLDHPGEEVLRNLVIDEARIAREVVMELYELAGRPLPAYFPKRPVEQIYDVDLIEWLELIDTRVLSLEESGNKLVARAADTIPVYEVERYLRVLPQGVKAHRKGHSIIIEGKESYLKWVSAGSPATRSFWSRLKEKLSGI